MSMVGPNIAELNAERHIKRRCDGQYKHGGADIAEFEMLSCIRSVDAMATRLLSSVGLCVNSRGLGHRKVENMGLKSLS